MRAAALACLALGSTLFAQSVGAPAGSQPVLDQARAKSDPSETSRFLPLVPRWSVALSAPPAGPPLIAGAVVVAPLQTGGVVALKLSDGTEMWRTEIDAARPASADAERLYVASRDAVHAVSLTTGKTIWSVDTGTLTATPLVHAGWVIVAGVGTVTALRATDGSVVWRRTMGPVEVRPAIDGDLLYVPLLNNRLAALRLPNGETAWEARLDGEPGEPLAAGGRVYAGSTDKYFYAFDADHGELKWRQHAGAAPRGRPEVDDDHIYFVSRDNVLRALDRGHGARKWASPLRYRPAAGAVLIGSAVLVPGAVTALPVFGLNGNPLTDVRFPSTLVGVSNVGANEADHPIVAAVTGDLQHPWTLWLLESSIDPPAIPMVDLTVLPGVTVEIVIPQ